MCGATSPALSLRCVQTRFLRRWVCVPARRDDQGRAAVGQGRAFIASPCARKECLCVCVCTRTLCTNAHTPPIPPPACDSHMPPTPTRALLSITTITIATTTAIPTSAPPPLPTLAHGPSFTRPARQPLTHHSCLQQLHPHARARPAASPRDAASLKARGPTRARLRRTTSPSLARRATAARSVFRAASWA
jgi:hypothetical protein